MAVRLLLGAVAASTLLHGNLAAQTVSGSVFEERQRHPVSGAIVLLVDDSGRTAGGDITDDLGVFRVRAPNPGEFHLRVQRIGYGDVETPPFRLNAGDSVHRDISAPNLPIELAPITAEARRRCVVDPVQSRALVALWNEARKALEATRITEERGVYRFRVRRDTRRLDLATLRVVRDSTRTTVGYAEGSPFVSAPAAGLLERGFIEDTDSGTYYFAPDAHLLLSDAFAAAYCFRIAEDQGDGLVGIAFEPAARVGPPAIRGSAWLDATTYSLRFLEYGYVRAEFPEGPADRIGGRLSFEKLPGGEWIVRDWRIRMPVVVERQLPYAGRLAARRIITAFTEESGEVLEVLARSGEVVGGSVLASIAGTVYDSIANAPLAGANIFLVGTGYSATADDAGEFILEDLPSGEFELGFSHPKLSVYGVVARPSAISIEDGYDYQMVLAVPAAAAHREENRCGRYPPDRRATESAIVVGRALDWVTRVPLAGAEITFSWAVGDGDGSRVLKTVAGAGGAFVACGLPTDRTIAAEMRYLGTSSGESTLPPIGTFGFVEHELEIRFARAGSVTIQLWNAETNEPIAAASAAFPDLGMRQTTGADGIATFNEIPPGAHRLEIEHSRYGTYQEVISISDSPMVIDVLVPTSVITLQPLEVSVRTSRSALEMARRTRGSRADILTRQEIAVKERTAHHLGDLVREFPGLSVREVAPAVGGGLRTGVCIESRRGAVRLAMDPEEPPCAYVAIVLDGMFLPPPARGSAPQQRAAYEALFVQIPISQIESIEYLPAAEAGVRYGTGTRGGALLIFTRGNGPYVEGGRR